MNLTSDRRFGAAVKPASGHEKRLGEHAHTVRLTTLGELAAGLSHELAQPLLAAHNFTAVALSLCRKSPATNPELVEALKDVDAQVERAVQIVKRIQGFIARRSPTREAFDLNAAVHEAAALLHHDLLERKIELKLGLRFVLPLVFADNILVQQVIINLLRNAMDAISECHCETRDIEIETALDPPGHVRLTVSDHGPGIAAEDVEAIFTPFHSTKSSGLGLGLSLSRTIIEASDGQLWAANRLSGGAIFFLTLPTA